ncbi:hypothetical protein HPB49_004153 [Dermacentor silvarum]|uniref:Uncharacterized protein n=1 Tax=Dermacentor silvarum TaxID=543639 RepID=A0ACB8DUE6_DERSI|nr:hypothetical protein HPB49_004153 [Dermacentor silvarum]
MRLGHLPRRHQHRPGCIVLDHQAESGVAERHYPRGSQTRGLQRGGCDLRGPERFTFYRCHVAYVRLYKKTVPVCSCCGTIGHRATACFCSRCGSQVPTTPEGLAQHDCQPRCILSTGPHETGARGCPGKYRKSIKPSQPVSPHPASPPPRTLRQGRAPLTQPKAGSRSKAPPPATP